MDHQYRTLTWTRMPGVPDPYPSTALAAEGWAVLVNVTLAGSGPDTQSAIRYVLLSRPTPHHHHDR